MTSSPPNKLFDGQTGFPTPNAPPEDTGCRVFIIPSDEEWFALFMAAALTLTYEWAWFKNGDLSQAEAAAAWSDIIDAAYQRSILGTCLIDVPAPYWDETSADDADDQMPVETQIWYGEIVAMPALLIAEDAELTFLDNIGIWAIAGFIAYAGLPGAAIAFVPLARKFTLAFKQHSLGGVVSVLFDFLHLADIDTYNVEDGVMEMIVSMPDDGMSHTLYVEMSEDNPHGIDGPNIQVIRKRLSPEDVTPPNIRWNEDCNCVQQTSDGGTTWVDSPTQDPRTSTIFQVPARTTGDPRCDSAQQMHDRVKHMLDALITSSDILQAINAVVAVVAVFFFEVGIVIEALWAIVGAIFSIGTTTLAAALTDDQYDLLLCIFYCNIGSDGVVTADQFAMIQTAVTAQLNATAAFAINQALDSIGFVGLTNAGALGEVTGDCSACDCGWCYTFDFAASDGGWTPQVISGLNFAVYTAGTGWQCRVQTDGCSDHAYCYMEFAFGATVSNLDVVQLEFASAIGSFDGNAMYQLLAGAVVNTAHFDDGVVTMHTASLAPAVATDTLRIDLNKCGIASPGFTEVRITFRGFGTNPFGSSNCT